MPISNYEKTRDSMGREFLKYDQNAMIDKYHLKYDDEYLYLRFVSREYRIGRKTGKVEWTEDGFVHTVQGNYNESMTIYDILCYAKAGCRLSGRFCTVRNLKGVVANSGLGEDFFTDYRKKFEHRTEDLKEACKKLGGVEYLKADVSYRLPLFDFLPVVLQFWDSDDEFDAVLKIMWDENILDYMHYETTYYAASCLLERIYSLFGKQ